MVHRDNFNIKNIRILAGVNNHKLSRPWPVRAITYLLHTDSMEQSSSWEANRFKASQEISSSAVQKF
jgi:hypothetical protein